MHISRIRKKVSFTGFSYVTITTLDKGGGLPVELSLGQNLKLFRGKQTQAEFAKALGISSNTVSTLEQNKQIPSIDLFIKICNTLQVSADELLNLPLDLDYPNVRLRNLATTLLSIRESKLGLTQTQLAKQLNISVSTLSKYERGNRTPPLPRIKLFCETYKISADYVLGIERIEK